MKLKRFLLRYEPPGVGLEIEDDEGEIAVRHKELVPVGEVTSEMHILALVEELCASEPGLLNPRKHRGALIQLLARLYQVETFGGTGKEPATQEITDIGDDAGAVSSPESHKKHKHKHKHRHEDEEDEHEEEEIAPLKEGGSAASGKQVLKDGDKVVIIGLEGKMETLNGERAVVLKVNSKKDKYEVLIASNEQECKLKGSTHLLAIINVPMPLSVGTCVVLGALRNHTELNGCIASVVDVRNLGTHYEVRTVDKGQLFRVKAEHVTPVEASVAVDRVEKQQDHQSRAEGDGEFLDAGCIIEVVGLKSNINFNGQQATIVLVDRDRGRYEVKMGDESIKKLKVENARLVAFAPSVPLPLSPSPGGYGAALVRGLGALGSRSTGQLLGGAKRQNKGTLQNLGDPSAEEKDAAALRSIRGRGL